MASSWLEVVWEIIEVLPAGQYKVRLCDMDFVVLGYQSGKMKQNKITIVEWDYVKIEINEYDNTQWRIVYRFKDIPEEYKKKKE